MTPGEIARSFREAKNKNSQLKILAELNACPKKEIIRVLEDQGIRIAEIKTEISRSIKRQKGRNPHKAFGELDTEEEEMQEKPEKNETQQPKNRKSPLADKNQELLETILEHFDRIDEEVKAKEKELNRLQEIHERLGDLLDCMKA